MNTLILKKPETCIIHSFCNEQFIKILENDGQVKLSCFIREFLNDINKGSVWCDEGFKNIHHFYNPKTGKGISGLTSADIVFKEYLLIAKKAFQNSNKEKGFFYIGAALHIIQDLCVPHHALGYLLNGHREFESWAINNYLSFAVHCEGKYSFKRPNEILDYNATNAIEFSELINNPSTKNKKDASEFLLKLAQQTSASLVFLLSKSFLSFACD